MSYETNHLSGSYLGLWDTKINFLLRLKGLKTALKIRLLCYV